MEAVVFDMDGTMVDTEALYHLAWRNAAKNLGYTLNTEILYATTGKRMDDCYAIIQDRMGDEFPMSAFKAGWWAYWQEHAETRGIARKPGLDQLLNWLDAQGIPKAVATSSARAEAIYTLERAGILDRFSIIVTGDQIVNGKPAPDIFLLAAERLGVAAHSCVAVEDSEAGVYAASSAGMTTFMVPDLIYPGPDVTTRAFRVVKSLHDVHAWIENQWQAIS
ncbi:MAG: HAD family phosphatase [Caldilineaceae bacterium]